MALKGLCSRRPTARATTDGVMFTIAMSSRSSNKMALRPAYCLL